MAILFYTFFLFGPGLIAVYILNLSRHRFLFSFAISLSVFIFSQIPFRIGGGQLDHWIWVYSILVISICGVAFLIGYRCPPRAYRQYFFRRKTVTQLPTRLAIFSWITVSIAWVATYSIIGPYTEVPSDFWNHLLRLQWETTRLEQRELAAYSSGFPWLTLLNREYAHSLHAIVALFSNLSGTQIAFWGQLSTTLAFIGAAFWFFYAQMISEWSERKRVVITLLSTTLLILWMGTGDFAFVRYYASAPIILSIPLLFLGILIVIDYLRTSRYSAPQVIGAVTLILGLQSLIHIQEGIILLVFITTIAMLARTQTWISSNSGWPADRRDQISNLARLVSITTIIGILTVLVFFSPLPQHPGVVFKPESNSILWGNLWIIDPKRQVWATITAGGLVSFVAIFSNWREFRFFPYVAAGAILPLLTVFNPIFIHVWDRLLPVTILWRFVLFVPVSLVTAIAICSLDLRNWDLRKNFTALIGVLSCLLILPLAKWEDSWITTRAGSFIPLEQNQSIFWLQDVTRFLNSQSKNLLLTDPVTSYVLRSQTKHSIPGSKFYAHSSGIDFTKITPAEFLKQANNVIVVINLRNGPDSNTTNALRHWEPDELSVSRYYPPDFEITLINYGFNKVWSNRDVTILSLQHDIE